MPTSATAHIQKIAPGPPRVNATATPARLPVPTRDARLVHKAWNGVIPLLSAGAALSTERKNSGKWRNCMKPSRIVK
ncbi:hypothetical protein D3C86_2166930 [compost metagenome]